MKSDDAIKERPMSTFNGVFALVLLIAVALAMLAGAVEIIRSIGPPPNKQVGLLMFLGGAVTVGLSIAALRFLANGLYIVQPNQAVALTLFGRYAGTTRAEGLHYVNPLMGKQKISLRVRNFDSETLKVNELEGSPIEIAAVVVWRVIDSAQALFVVDDFVQFVKTQAESALRQMATTYPYDGHDEPGCIALRSHADEISVRLQSEIQDRLSQAGVEVIEARVSHLAYAREIAAAMLQRQQAGAVIAARRRIVDGAVGMVESALEQLSERKVVELDDERRAAMVSNLLVVLCGDRNTQPVVNAGSLY